MENSNTFIIEQINLHTKWVKSLGSEGKQLTLEDAIFANLDLDEIELSQAIIPGAIFDISRLMKSNLFCASLASASYINK